MQPIQFISHVSHEPLPPQDMSPLPPTKLPRTKKGKTQKVAASSPLVKQNKQVQSTSAELEALLSQKKKIAAEIEALIKGTGQMNIQPEIKSKKNTEPDPENKQIIKKENIPANVPNIVEAKNSPNPERIDSKMELKALKWKKKKERKAERAALVTAEADSNKRASAQVRIGVSKENTVQQPISRQAEVCLSF